MVNKLDGVLRLVDNRIVLGDSTFCAQPRVIAVLHPKEPVDAEALEYILRCANGHARAKVRPPWFEPVILPLVDPTLAFERRPIPLPNPPKEVPARYVPIVDDGEGHID